MAVVGELLVLIGANNGGLMAGIAQSEAALKGYSATAGTHHGLVASAAQAAGLAVGAAAAVTAVGLGVAANAAADFQEQMAIVNTIAHETPEELSKTGAEIRKMAAETGQPLGDMTKAFYDLLSAGVPVKDAMSVLGNSTTLAIGGLATTAQTVDLLTTAMNAYGLTTKGVATATDQFALAVQDGKVTADQIAASFADVAPTAQNAGIGIDEIAAAYASLTAQGVQASVAMTQMQRAIIELQTPNKALAELQKETGNNFADIAAHQGLVEALQKMRTAAEAHGVTLRDLFGRQEAYNFLIETTGPHLAAYATELERMHNANGTAASQAAERMNTLNRQGAIFGDTFGNLLITVGTPLLPFLTGLVQNMTAAAQAASDWVSGFPNLGAALASLIPSDLGGAFNSIVTALGPIGERIGGQLRTWASAFVDWVSPMIPPALNALGQFAAQVVSWISDQAPGWLDQLGQWAAAFVDWVSPMIPKALDALGKLASQAISWISDRIPDFVSSLQDWADSFIDWIKPIAGKALDSLGTFATTLIGWLGDQVPIMTKNAGPVGKAISDAIVGALSGLPGLVGDAISNATKNFDVSKVPENIKTVLTGIAIIGAATAAGQIVGAAFATAHAAAAAVVNGVTDLFKGAWEAERKVLASIAAAAGAVVGAAFSLAFRAAAATVQLIIAPFTAALEPVKTALIGAVAPVGAEVGAAMDGAITAGMIAGAPLLAVAAVSAILAAITLNLAGQSGKGGREATAAARGLNPAGVREEDGPPRANAYLDWLAAQQHHIRHIPQFASGGIVPGTGPQLIVAHGGETVTPAGRGGGEIHVHVHNRIELEGRTVAEFIEEHLFRSASTFSSGFMAGNPVTGA